MKKSLIFIFVLIDVITLSALTEAAAPDALRLDPVPESVNAVRFDPSYYYNAPVRANVLAQRLAEQWQTHGVNVVFYKAYDPVHGAKYKTSYELNEMADYGRQNLLNYVLEACGEREIQVMAWLPAFQHKPAWEQHPEWRVKNPDGSDYRLNEESYPLCAANPEVRSWWVGLIRDLLEHYNGLAGIDIGEPVVRWQSAYCGCAFCQQQIRELGFGDASALGLSKTLLASIEAIHDFRKLACVTSVVSPKVDGRLFTPAEQRGYTGFDLEALLEAPQKPDWVSLELMWQQWADLHRNPARFNPAWVEGAAAALREQVAERSRLLVHLELTPFGQQRVDSGMLQESMRAAKRAELPDIDLYDTHQIERDEAWPDVAAGFAWQPARRILVVSDPIGENDARQVASLLSHFKVETEILLLDADKPYTPGRLAGKDLLFYIGVDPKFILPKAFLQEAAGFKGSLAWIHLGLGQYLEQPGLPDHGIRYLSSAADSAWNRVRYKQALLPREDPDFDRIALTDSARVQILAWMEKGAERLPYALHSRNLWYFADLTTAFVREGGSYIVFADLLHDILRQPHQTRRLAMVRIEDLSPLSDAASLRRIADYLHGEEVPFAISLVPFYLDPASNTAASLSDQPELVAAIRYMVRKGGVIVMHGNTHQYRGETTADYEFWDMMHNEPLFSDSREYVRERIETGLKEMARNELWPVTWETPHYGASQLAYSVINTYFSSAYERRQTIDLHGSDQLLPWLIYEHTAGGKIIPENLGYIPLSDQRSGPLLEAARNNLALRDGVASFFFHPFCDITVLKEIIPGLKKMGYRFTDPRHTCQQVRGPGFRVVTGSGRVELPLTSAYLREFYIDEHGSIRDEHYSEALHSDTVRKEVVVPEGWIYVAAAAPTRPKGALAILAADIAGRVPRLKGYIGAVKPLVVPDEPPARMVMLYHSDAPARLLRDQDNWEQALGSVGIDGMRLDVGQFFTVPEGINLIVVPAAAASVLDQQQILLLVRSVQNGANLILECPSALSSALGIQRHEESRLVKAVTDEYYPTVRITWAAADTLAAFETEYDYITYATDPVSGWPAVIGSEYGEGRFLYWGTLFDPETRGGYGRYPFLPEMLRYQFGLKPLVRREAVEIFFDPGSREEISIEDLIKMWRKNGVRTIYAAGWHSYRDYTYDYGRLIALAHQNAIRVYLWLELPHVSDKFWLDHPEWREKNALGADADTSGAHWRRPMALNITACRDAVMAELRNMLLAHPWDGVNLAELYYESAAGPAEPRWFTPMNQDFREFFSQRHGYDPRLLFDPSSRRYWQRDSRALQAIYLLREEMVNDQIRRFVTLFRQVEAEKKTSWEIIVTTLDAAMAPSTAAAVGVNTAAIAALADEFPFTLQLEEPPQANPAGPEDYMAMIDHGAASSRGRIPLATLNLVDRPQRPGLVTPQITGLELYRTLQEGQARGARLPLNSEASLYEVDSGYLPLALAAATRESLSVAQWRIDAATTVSLLLDPKQHPDVLVDGSVWPAYHRGHLILPAGRHTIEPLDRTSSFFKDFWAEGRLIALSGELLELQRIVRGIRLRYRSETANWMVLSEKPHAIEVDGQEKRPAVMRGELGYAFALPAGEHRAEIYTTSRTTQLVKQISLALSGLIAGGGLLFGIVLGFLYLKNAGRHRKTAV
ncbi:MAG TPA: DUF2334 domain-containing protein [bacterium]|nr:DUF2334 domain-containing protein [bacterium]HQJ65600.1 DUF2334 domain-containing protein [bacterium]